MNGVGIRNFVSIKMLGKLTPPPHTHTHKHTHAQTHTRVGGLYLHLSTPLAKVAVRSQTVVLLLLICCLLLLPLWESVIVLCVVYVTLCPF